MLLISVSEYRYPFHEIDLLHTHPLLCNERRRPTQTLCVVDPEMSRLSLEGLMKLSTQERKVVGIS